MKHFVVPALLAFAAAAFATPPPVGPHGEPARKLAIYAPRPKVPAEARARHLTGAGVCVVYVRPDGQSNVLRCFNPLASPFSIKPRSMLSRAGGLSQAQ